MKKITSPPLQAFSWQHSNTADYNFMDEINMVKISEDTQKSEIREKAELYINTIYRDRNVNNYHPKSNLSIQTEGGRDFYHRKLKLIKVAKERKSLQGYLQVIRGEHYELGLEIQEYIANNNLDHDKPDDPRWGVLQELNDKYFINQWLLEKHGRKFN